MYYHGTESHNLSRNPAWICDRGSHSHLASCLWTIKQSYHTDCVSRSQHPTATTETPDDSALHINVQIKKNTPNCITYRADQIQPCL